MSKKKRLSYEKKLKACKLYKSDKGSYKFIADKFGISESGFRLLYYKYINFGPEALRMKAKDQSYTKKFKEQVIEAYENGEGSRREIAAKYKIHNDSLITRWVLGYNKNIKTTYSGSGGEVIMARKTILDERIKIIEYLIEHELDYNKVSVHFNVSYQQVYTWYKKYQKLGVEGLVDKRGRNKHESELSELELLRRENKRLKRELELSKAAENVLKKNRNWKKKPAYVS